MAGYHLLDRVSLPVSLLCSLYIMSASPHLFLLIAHPFIHPHLTNPPAPGSGYCYSAYVSPDVALPRPSCPAGYSLSPVGVCTKKVQVATKTCFVGPVCMAPFNQTGNATCWDDKVRSGCTRAPEG
jgi:hypothetical protein